MDAYFIVDSERRMKDQNKMFNDLSGTRQQAGDGHKHCYDMVKLELCQKDCIALRALKAGKTVQVNEIHGKGLDGHDLVLMGRATPLKDSKGDIHSVLVTYRDITEETRTMERLHKIEKESRQEKDILLRNLSEKTQEAEKLKKDLETARSGH